MNLLAIQLNALVMSVFLSIERLGVGGALSISASALRLAAASMRKLKSMVGKESKWVARAVWVAAGYWNGK